MKLFSIRSLTSLDSMLSTSTLAAILSLVMIAEDLPNFASFLINVGKRHRQRLGLRRQFHLSWSKTYQRQRLSTPSFQNDTTNLSNSSANNFCSHLSFIHSPLQALRTSLPEPSDRPSIPQNVFSIAIFPPKHVDFPTGQTGDPECLYRAEIPRVAVQMARLSNSFPAHRHCTRPYLLTRRRT